LPSIQQILKEYWGYDAFRPLQEDIIHSILAGKDTLALLPTGGGKSVCFQVPAMAGEGLCIVISPLIALMKDQVEGLHKKGIPAAAVYAGMRWKEVDNTFKNAANGQYKFLYLSPERLETRHFAEYLPAFDIHLLAIDEAHCISQWGYDFRPSYLRIAALRKLLPGVPVLALTASATPDVQEDICVRLDFAGRQIFRPSFSRPNLSYSVFNEDAKPGKLVDILQKVKGTGIVYCKSRKRTKEIADLLNLHGIEAGHYHAGLSQEERHQKQHAWINNKIRVMVCTNAFGMGIDKPDVRVVVHADIPDCLENYYQEAGRAGRDTQKAYAVLLYHPKDLDDLRMLPSTRFPPMEEVRKIYQAVVNYLQVPSQYGEGLYYEFDLDDFVRTFRLNILTVMSVMKTLEQEKILAFNEQVFLPATLSFTCTKNDIETFEARYPDIEPLIKTLLRTYSGIFDQPVPIREKQLAYLLKTPEENIRQSLQQLQFYGLIEYNPQKDKPQVFFLQNRPRTEDLYIDAVAYRQRKERLIKRIAAMVAYTTETSACRTLLLGTYFGDDATGRCGVCDNCLRLQREHIPANNLYPQILGLLSKEKRTAAALAEQIKDNSKEQVWAAIDLLLNEEKIKMGEDGRLSL
jgi:ATP-dependent DNA helicase RecQ